MSVAFDFNTSSNCSAFFSPLDCSDVLYNERKAVNCLIDTTVQLCTHHKVQAQRVSCMSRVVSKMVPQLSRQKLVPLYLFQEKTTNIERNPFCFCLSFYLKTNTSRFDTESRSSQKQVVQLSKAVGVSLRENNKGVNPNKKEC